MILTFALPGLLSTILDLPPESTSSAVTAITASSTLTSVPTSTIKTSTITTNTTGSCTLISTVFPTTLPDVSTPLPTGTRYYYQCGSSVVDVDLAVSGTSTITYPALGNTTSLPAGYTQISASNGQPVTTFPLKTTSEAPSLTSPQSSATESAPSATVTHSRGTKGQSLPQSFMSLAVAVGMAVLASL